MGVSQWIREGFPEEGSLKLGFDGWGGVFQLERMAQGTISEAQGSVDGVTRKRKEPGRQEWQVEAMWEIT